MSTQNFSLLTVQFMNNSASISVEAGAFNFTGAQIINYEFKVNPNTNMNYANGGTCFPDTILAKLIGDPTNTYTWNAINNSW